RHRDPRWCAGRGPGAPPDGEERRGGHPFAPQVQGQPRALREAHPQAPHRHRRPHPQGGRLAHASGPSGRRQHRDQALRFDMADINNKISKGMLGKKLGMTQVWNDAGKLIPVTVIELAPNVVTQVRTPEKDGYNAVQIAAGEIDPRKVNQPLSGHFQAAGVTPRRQVAEIRTADAADYTAGQEITVGDTFEAGQLVDVVGTSNGKGFAGTMKRHNISGVGASHGAHRNHRKPGSIGASATPSRVFKGTRMAGRMGGERVTVLNLTVHAVDAEKGLLLVKGAVPGARGRVVYVRNAVKGA